MHDKLLGKVVAIPGEGIVIMTMPEIAKVYHNVVYFVHGIVCNPDWNSFFQLEAPARRSMVLCLFLILIFLINSLNTDNAREIEVMSSVSELVVE